MDKEIRPRRNVSHDDAFEITAGDAIVIKKHVIAMVSEVLENGQSPQNIGAPIADKNSFLNALGTTPRYIRTDGTREEFRLLTALGTRPLDALRAGTSVDAELLGIQSRIGTLEPGELADIIAMPDDPTQNIRQTEKVFLVIKEGIIYRDDHGHR